MGLPGTTAQREMDCSLHYVGPERGRRAAQRPQRERRAVEHLLREAALALSQDGDALCHGSLPAPKNKQQTRPALLVLRSREIAAAFLLERDVALAQNRRYWATEWAMREHPDMCRTTEEKDVFLSTVRRWARKATKGAYGLVAGIVHCGDSGFGGSQQAWSQSAQESCTVLLPPSKRRRLRGGGGPGHMKVPCIGEELFAWFVDTLTNVKGDCRRACCCTEQS